MRRHLLAVELDSDMDLTTLASRRVQIEAIANNRYRVSPLLRRKLAANPNGARFHA